MTTHVYACNGLIKARSLGKNLGMRLRSNLGMRLRSNLGMRLRSNLGMRLGKNLGMRLEYSLHIISYLWYLYSIPYRTLCMQMVDCICVCNSEKLCMLPWEALFWQLLLLWARGVWVIRRWRCLTWREFPSLRCLLLLLKPAVGWERILLYKKVVYKMMSGGRLEAWLIVPCIHNAAVHQKCHASRHPPDFILCRSFTRPSTASGDRRPRNEAIQAVCCLQKAA